MYLLPRHPEPSEHTIPCWQKRRQKHGYMDTCTCPTQASGQLVRGNSVKTARQPQRISQAINRSLVLIVIGWKKEKDWLMKFTLP